MGIQTDMTWRRGDKKNLIVLMQGNPSMAGWTAQLELTVPVIGTVLLSKSAISIDPVGLTITFDIESTDTASITYNSIEYNVWRTDPGAAEGSLAYGTITLQGNPLI